MSTSASTVITDSTASDIPTVSVLGYYQGRFSKHKIGGLCRGKETWIDGTLDKNRNDIHRMIISGAIFANYRFQQIKRGIECIGVSLPEMLSVITKDQQVVAVIEDASVIAPVGVAGYQQYELSRMGMAKNAKFSRWQKLCVTKADFAMALDYGAQVFIINPEKRDVEEEWTPSPPPEYGTDVVPPLLSNQTFGEVYRLIGSRIYTQDYARYMPDALWGVLGSAQGVIVLHADKTDDCIAWYSQQKRDVSKLVQAFLAMHHPQILMVSCAIPPMLIRWDRNIRDMKRNCQKNNEEFPEQLLPFFPKNQNSTDEIDALLEDGEDDSYSSEDDSEQNVDASDTLEDVSGEEDSSAMDDEGQSEDKSSEEY